MKGAATERHTGAFDTVPIDYGRVQQQLANVQQIRPLLWRDVAMFLALAQAQLNTRDTANGRSNRRPARFICGTPAATCAG